jgi:YHS domain-containing protein
MSIMSSKLPTCNDPVCGMAVDVKTALYAEFRGQTFHFCSYACRTKFVASHAESAKQKKTGGLQDLADGDFGAL